MKVEIKLEDPKHCNLCPCHYIEILGTDTLYGCTMNYYKPKTRKTPEDVSFDFKRPKRCIKKNGN